MEPKGAVEHNLNNGGIKASPLSYPLSAGAVQDMVGVLQDIALIQQRGNQGERGSPFVTANADARPPQQRRHDDKDKGDMRSNIYSQEPDEDVDDMLSIFPTIDARVMCNLRDGRIFVGTFRSVDQFANIVLTNVVERVFVGNQYGENVQGLVLIRGDNVVMMGEISEGADGQYPGFTKVCFQEILTLQATHTQAVKEREMQRLESFKTRGLNYAALHHQDHKAFAERFQAPDDQFN